MYIGLLLVIFVVAVTSVAVARACDRPVAVVLARTLTTLMLAGGSIAVPRAAPAQWAAQPAGAHSARPGGPPVAPTVPIAVAALGRPATDRAAPRRRSAAPYVWGGAAVGVLAMGGGLALYFRRTKGECLCNPVALAPAFAGAAALGAGAGYVTYRVWGR